MDNYVCVWFFFWGGGRKGGQGGGVNHIYTPLLLPSDIKFKLWIIYYLSSASTSSFQPASNAGEQVQVLVTNELSDIF